MSATITQDGDLLLPSGRVLRFEGRVLEAIGAGSAVVVVLDPDRDEGVSRNACAVEADGSIRWRVGPFDFPHGPSPYTGVYVHDGLLFLYNRCGVECRIDVATGEILSAELIK